jgi:hypothetical protein
MPHRESKTRRHRGLRGAGALAGLALLLVLLGTPVAAGSPAGTAPVANAAPQDPARAHPPLYSAWDRALVEAGGPAASRPAGDPFPAQAPPIDLDYLLAIDDPGSGLAHVTLTVRNLSAPTLDVEEHGYHGLYVNVLALTARGPEGQPLAMQRLIDAGTSWAGQRADVWRVQCEGLSTLTLRYTVRPGLQDGEHGRRGSIGHDFALLAGEYVFLVPRGVPVGAVSVRFTLPPGWQVYAPWTAQDQVYDPALPEGRVVDSLAISNFALGQFDVYTQTVGTTQLVVAAYAPWPAAVKEELARQSAEILAYQTAVFGGSVGESYLVLFCPPTPEGEDIYAGEWSTSQGYSIHVAEDGSFWGKWDMFAHQAFHRWNGWAWGLHGYHAWFGEGPNVLYELKTVTRLRITRPYGDMERELQRYYTLYLQDYVTTGKDRPLVSERGELDAFLIYRKGAMVAFLLAQEITLRTEGQRHMDDFLQALVSRYGRYALPCDEACLQAELEALTGSDWVRFFDAYVYGAEPLPMDWAFEDDDGDGLSNALEIGWDTDPRRADTDGDGHHDGSEVVHGSDPRDPASVPHLAYLPALSRNHAQAAPPPPLEGLGDDWPDGVLLAEDVQGDSVDAAGTDLKAVYQVTGPESVHLFVEGYGPAFARGALEMDLLITEGAASPWILRLYAQANGSLTASADRDGDGQWESYPLPGAGVSWGRLLALQIPLAPFQAPLEWTLILARLWAEVEGEGAWVDTIRP